MLSIPYMFYYSYYCNYQYFLTIAIFCDVSAKRYLENTLLEVKAQSIIYYLHISNSINYSDFINLLLLCYSYFEAWHGICEYERERNG